MVALEAIGTAVHSCRSPTDLVGKVKVSDGTLLATRARASVKGSEGLGDRNTGEELPAQRGALVLVGTSPKLGVALLDLVTSLDGVLDGRRVAGRSARGQTTQNTAPHQVCIVNQHFNQFSHHPHPLSF